MKEQPISDKPTYESVFKQIEQAVQDMTGTKWTYTPEPNPTPTPKPTLHSDLIDTFNQLQSQASQIAKSKGWWDKPREDGTLIALCHAELSELLEYLRHGNPPSDHIPEFSGAEEEAADVLIRLMDLAAHHGWNIAGALVAKMEFNQGRAYKHGGKAF